MINDGFRLWPEQASNHASNVDWLYFFLLCMSAAFTVGIAGSIIFFAIKYRRGNQRVDRTIHGHGSMTLEITWTVLPFLLSLILFTWGAKLYFDERRTPDDALEVNVVGKQWMWKVQHPSGRREINEIHVPVGTPVRLVGISEDVIHSLYIPVFRIKRDILPGRYSSIWFEATRTGQFHLFCAEYCGTNHSRMIGTVIVMEPADFEAWLSGEHGNESPAEKGRRLFEELRCGTCHMPQTGTVRCPPLFNLYTRKVVLNNDQVVTADEDYLRESILRPNAKVVKGYEALMPSFDGQLNEEQIIQLIAYLKSLGTP